MIGARARVFRRDRPERTHKRLETDRSRAMPFDDMGYERHTSDLDKTGDGRRCLAAAMEEADAVFLKTPILRAIKGATGRRYSRVEAFNDAPLTTHVLILQVLRHAREDIIRAAAEQGRAECVRQVEASSRFARAWNSLRKMFG
jgi:hypothetical protein